jgi:hypothetical protein
VSEPEGRGVAWAEEPEASEPERRGLQTHMLFGSVLILACSRGSRTKHRRPFWRKK